MFLPDRGFVLRSWYKSKKFWGTFLACVLRLVGGHNGWDMDVIEGASNILFGGVVVEGVVDAAAAFAREIRRVR
jgi:hypothetical protein